MKQESKICNQLKNKTVLITGGTGSLGQALTKHLLQTKVFETNHEGNRKSLRFSVWLTWRMVVQKKNPFCLSFIRCPNCEVLVVFDEHRLL